MKGVTLKVSICVLALALLVALGCASERDMRSRVEVLHSEDWYEDDAVQTELPGDPQPVRSKDVEPTVDTREAEQDSVQASPEGDATESP